MESRHPAAVRLDRFAGDLLDLTLGHCPVVLVTLAVRIVAASAIPRAFAGSSGGTDRAVFDCMLPYAIVSFVQTILLVVVVYTIDPVLVLLPVLRSDTDVFSNDFVREFGVALLVFALIGLVARFLGPLQMISCWHHLRLVLVVLHLQVHEFDLRVYYP